MVRTLFAFGVLLGLAARAQIFVAPERPFQSRVRHADFEWRTIDLDIPVEAAALEAPSASDGGSPGPMDGGSPDAGGGTLAEGRARSGKLRLYFYESERAIAERAAASIADSYRTLVRDFNYVPERSFPFILYSSYQEFLQTNLFPLQEGVLGVTSPVDLKLTLPYFGDRRQFEEVARHELAHQFTIQKVRSLAKAKRTFGDPLGLLPLWFIEGLAEYHAHGRGIAPEADLEVRDLLVNPDVKEGFALLGFFEDRPGSVLWTYRAGNLRCAFLEEAYGKGFLQRLLTETVGMSTRLIRTWPKSPFQALLQRLTGDDPPAVQRKFEAWLKRRAFPAWLASDQELPPPRLPFAEEPFPGVVTSLASSPDGNVLLARVIHGELGETRLVLAHRAAPARKRTVAVDGAPGFESLHPIGARSFSLGREKLVYLAERQGADGLYLQDYRVEHGKKDSDTSLHLGARRRVSLSDLGLVAAFSPALSPDGRAVALVGLDPSGQRDLYVLELAPAEGGPARLERVTRDVFSERQASWGPRGIVFSSDATAHGKYNLFLARREAGAGGWQLERLTEEARDAVDPAALADGSTVFTAFDGSSANLHRLSPTGRLSRLGRVPTGLFDSGPGTDGRLWALVLRSGQRRPAEVPLEAALEESGPPGSSAESAPPGDATSPDATAMGESEPLPPPTLPLVDAAAYRPYALESWDLGPVLAFVGGGAGGIIGQAFASANDRLRDRGLALSLSIYGDWELTDGYLLHYDQSRRQTYAGAVFHSLRFRTDHTFPDLPFGFTSLERFYGASLLARHPIDRFLHLQATLSVGALQPFLLPNLELYLATPELNGVGELASLWHQANPGPRLHGELTLRFGYDTLKDHPQAGPIDGSSVLLESTLGAQPFDSSAFANVRLDAQYVLQLFGRTHLDFRLGAGHTEGGRLAREFFLSSFDTLRGVPFGDARLIGREFLFSTAELRFPLNEIVRLVLLSDLEGVAGLDFGGVGASPLDAWNRRLLDVALGLNLGLGPFMVRLHFAKNFDIGAAAGLPVPEADWVTNFTVGIRGLGFFFGQDETPSRATLSPFHPAGIPPLGFQQR